MKKIIYKKIILVLLILFFVVFLNSLYVFSSVPYNSFIYNSKGEPVPAPHAYVFSDLIDGKQLGVGSLNNPADLIVKDNNVYILDSGNNRIICMTKNWEVYNIIDVFNNRGFQDSLNNPQGIFVLNEDIYVADTDNNRIIKFNIEGEFVKEIVSSSPEISEVIPGEYTFRPAKIVVNLGRIYIIARNVNEGLMVINLEGDFLGYIGAPRVTPNPIDLFWERFYTEEQRERTALRLPTEYTNISLTEDGFIFAIESNVIRKLNPAGTNILVGNPSKYFPTGLASRRTIGPYGTFLGNRPYFSAIIGGDLGIYSVVDRITGRIYTFDYSGNILYMFGGAGNKKGQLLNPVAIASINKKFLVLDSQANNIIIFEPTKYAETIYKALEKFNKGLYKNSIQLWQEVVKLNVNYDLAYSAIGKGLLRENQYIKAMEQFKIANDREGYSRAFFNYRQDYVNNNFNRIMMISLIILMFLYIILRIRKRLFIQKFSNKFYLAVTEGPLFSKSIFHILQSLKYSLYLIFHPFDGFWDLKHEKKGSLHSAGILLFLVVFTYIFMRQFTAFLFNPLQMKEVSVIAEVISILAPFILWCIINWLATTLLDGKGTLKDIIIFSAFSLTPFIIISFPLTIASHILTLQDGVFYYFLLSISILWTCGLLFFGTMTTHSYDLLKTFVVTIIIIIAIGFSLFITLVFFNIIDEAIGFFRTIYNEIVFRL